MVCMPLRQHKKFAHAFHQNRLVNPIFGTNSDCWWQLGYFSKTYEYESQLLTISVRLCVPTPSISKVDLRIAKLRYKSVHFGWDIIAWVYWISQITEQ